MTGNQLQQTNTETRPVKLAAFLEGKAEDFKAIKTVDGAKFLRVVKNAILRDPEIAEASTQSVYLECMKAINDGLLLDGREAALTRFKVNKRRQVNGRWEDNWIVEVVYIPMVAGIMKRVRASGEIKAWTVELVYMQEYEQGRFEYRAAPDPMIRHEPIIVGERGEVVAAYSAVKLVDGSHHYEVMTKAQLDAIKARTKSRKKKRVNNQEVEEITGPWATDVEEMYRKTVIRRHAKRLPVSSSVLDVANRVDALYEDRDPDYEPDTITDPEPAPAKSAAAKRLKAAAKATPAPVKEPDPDEGDDDNGDNIPLEGELIDGETGEIIGPDTGTINPEDEF